MEACDSFLWATRNSGDRVLLVPSSPFCLVHSLPAGENPTATIFCPSA